MAHHKPLVFALVLLLAAALLAIALSAPPTVNGALAVGLTVVAVLWSAHALHACGTSGGALSSVSIPMVREPLAVRRASYLDGFCNACRPNEWGAMPDNGKVLHVRLDSLTFRICEKHWDELQAGGNASLRASPGDRRRSRQRDES